MAEPAAADSRFLSFLLRHRPDTVGVTLDPAGWVDIDTLLAACAAHGRPIDRARLARIVEGDAKQRYETEGGRIRAAQGHSVAVDLGLAPVAPPPELFHGTVARNLPGIEARGLVPGRRQHVHLSPDEPTAVTVGARRGEPVVLRIDAAAMYARGHAFFRSANGVWLTAHVPPEFIHGLNAK